MPATGGKTLLPIDIPDGPLVTGWAKEVVRRLNMLTALKVDNQPALTFGDGNANLVLGTDPSTGEAVTVQTLVTIINAQNGRIAALEVAITGATIDATCNGDGTITVTLTWGT